MSFRDRHPSDTPLVLRSRSVSLPARRENVSRKNRILPLDPPRSGLNAIAEVPMALAFAVTQRFARSLRWVVVHHHRSSWTELQTDAMVGHCDLDLGLSTVPRCID